LVLGAWEERSERSARGQRHGALHGAALSRCEGENFGPLGVTNIRTFVNPQDPTRVAVLMDVADMDAVMAAMQTPAAAEAMDHDGVIADTLVILVET
jgi:hypothetical protein